MAALGVICSVVVPLAHAETPSSLPPIVVLGTNSFVEPAQNLPVAETSLSGRSLELAGIRSLIELPRAVPNFAQSHAGLGSFSDNYVIRGLGNTDFLSDPAVVVYVDDAPYGDGLTYTTDLLAIDHLEVFRGPQGTRFGKNAEAGVINIVSRRPTDQFEAEASASGATFDTQQYRVLTQGPLVKGSLYFGLAGQYSLSDGYIRNTFLHTDADERESSNGRGSLRWIPDEDWDVAFNATVDSFDDGIGLVSLAGDPRETMSDFDGQFDGLAHSQSLRVIGALERITLTSITTRRHYDLDPFEFDFDFSPLTGNTGIVKTAQTQWSEELRLRPSFEDQVWSWHGGFFFSTTDIDRHRGNYLFLPPIPIVGSDVTDYTAGSQTYALFGELGRTFWDKFEATIGLRLDYTARDLQRTRTLTLNTLPGPNVTEVNDDEGFFNAAPKLTLAYHFTDTIQAYGSTGVGFKPGGLSAFIDPPASAQFETERAWASELGVKSTWLDEKVTAKVAFFYTDVTDYQVEQFTPNGFDFTIVNAPEARMFGVEGELTVRPVAGLELSAFGGYTDAELDEYTNPFTGVTVHDTHAAYVPKYNAGVAVLYRHTSGLLARVGYAFLGETFFDPTISSLKQDGYGLLSARIGYEHKHFGLYLFGENLTDTEYFMKKIAPLNAGAPGLPQTFGVMLTVRL